MAAVMGLATIAGAGAAGQDKIDGKKLIGKWTPKDEQDKFVVEFDKDGKLKLDLGGMKTDGKYKLDGNKITIDVEIGGNKQTMVRTISKLTDTELVSKDDKDGMEDTLVRVKDEKKKDKK